jgi:hypothetical protein
LAGIPDSVWIDPIMKKTALALMCLALMNLGCSHAPPPGASGGLSASCDTSSNLLRNAGFAADENGNAVPWSGAQHAGEKSFELTLDGGQARIERTGTQPWFTYTQKIPVRSLRGAVMTFAAELSGELDDDGISHAFGTGAGLTLTIWGDPDPVMGGDRVLISHRFEHDPHLGDFDWTPVQMSFTVPDNATRLRLGFAHYADGWLAVRNPGLYRCSKTR